MKWLSLLLLALILLAWQGASGTLVPKILVSDPLSVAAVLQRWAVDGSLWRHIGATLLTAALGYVVGGGGGILLGFALATLPRLLDALSPVLGALFCLPKIALLPLLVIFFGIDIASKVVLVSSVVVFLTLFSTIDGVRNVPDDLVGALRLMGATRREILRKVVVPAALPFVFTGLRISVSYALTTTVVGELLSSNRGIGYLIESSAARLNSAGVFAAVFVLVVISVLATAGLSLIERR
jgi:NitT/TauT family transport system permease protein